MSKQKAKSVIKTFLLAFLTFLVAFPSVVSAQTNPYQQLQTPFYDPSSNGAIACSTGSTSGTSTSSAGSSGGSYTLDQVKTFASEPITSTWNISDSSVEQWFLSTGTATIGRYSLNSSNIGDITSAVQAANVSPIFFYLYTVNEGGSDRNLGFINHTDRSGLDAVAAATADAQYLADYSKMAGTNPSWVDAGNRVDFVPQNVKDAGDADFRSIPTGTIGRVYIPATAAATWEVYYPNGLKKAFNQVQDYWPPLAGAMQNIQSMGGDPLQGGATVSAGGAEGCTAGGVTGTGIAKAVSWAVMIANNDGYGYDQDTRESGWAKWQSDPSCTSQCGSFDCSSFIAAALTEAGYFKTNPEFGTGTDASGPEATDLISAGFTKVADSVTTSKDLLLGDILVWDGHTEMYIGGDQAVAAHQDDKGGIRSSQDGSQVGDQGTPTGGGEISVETFGPSLSSDPWIGVYRASN